MNGLLNLIANIVIFGLILWVINAFIPMPGAIKSLLNILVLIVLIIYVLQYFQLINTIIPMMQILR
ncbi:MAG: Thivi_2564 family membrane protein [Legionella sp.]|jgi:hypothetical protein